MSLEQFDNFFTRALQGDGVYMEVAEALIERSLANVGETVSKALSQGMNAIGDRTAQGAVTGTIKDTPQKTTTNIKNEANAAQKAIHAQKQADSKQVLDKAKPITSQATQNLTTEKPATGKKVQSPDKNSKPGLFSNLLTTGTNIFNNITSIFSPKPAPAAA
jgi:predicted lactoylglutathione lyase